MMEQDQKTRNINDTNIPTQLSLPYRRGVGLMVINKEKKVFVGKRIDTKYDAWQMPQGGIEEDETIHEAALRELKEETNIVEIKFISEVSRWLYYDLPEYLVTRLWQGKYRGQKQKWLLMYFYGDDSVIDIKTSNAEFQEWQWLDLNKIPEIIVPFQKHLYASIVNEFSSIIKDFQISKL